MTTQFMSGYTAGAATAIMVVYLVTGTAWWSRSMERKRFGDLHRRHYGRRFSIWDVLAAVGVLVWVVVWAAEVWARFGWIGWR